MNDRTCILTSGTGFLALGLVVGTLVAMSAQSLGQVLLAALFALFGGSLLVLFDKFTIPTQLKVTTAILGISIGTLGGVYSGLYVSEHQLLTPPNLRFQVKSATPSDESRKYLRENTLSDIRAIDTKYRAGLLTPEHAYEQIYALLGDR